MKYLWLVTLLWVGQALAADNNPDLEALRKAAEQGQADAQYELGILYEFGFRYPDYKVSAYSWYNRAAEQGNERAVKRRETLKGQLSAAELERATKVSAVTTPQPVAKTEPASVPKTEPTPAAVAPVAAPETPSTTPAVK